MISRALFIQILSTMLIKYTPQVFDATLKPQDSSGCQKCREVKYDFIIVGAGSAGSVLANRLSSNPEWTVLLIEAGQSEDFYTDTPASLDMGLFDTKYDWNYTTVSQKSACKDTKGNCQYPRGHVMGGTSTINGMMYVRGNPKDFDGWEAMGNRGWCYQDVLPYFQKFENMSIEGLSEDRLHHSVNGPLSIEYNRYQPSLLPSILKAAKQYGLNTVDYNGASQIGISRPQMTLQNGSRCSTSKAYLNPIKGRKNLVIFQNTLVTKVLFDPADSNKAIGVSCINDGAEFSVFAKQELILSAGAINTPQLLMLSGIGPKRHLDSLKIPVRKALPVGETLIDHPRVRMIFQLNSTQTCCFQFSEENIKKYAKNRIGPLTRNGIDLVAFLNERNRPENPPLVQVQIGRLNESSPNATDPKLALIVVYVFLSHPKSVGSVKLTNQDYRSAPLIDPNFFGNKEDAKTMIWGVKEIFKLMKLPALAKFSPKFDTKQFAECFPDAERIDDRSLECFLNFSNSFYHPVGTAKMGPVTDQSAVVDSTLKVHGIDKLRIVDASVMPYITAGNTNAPTIMIAEKAADMIIRDHTIGITKA